MYMNLFIPTQCASLCRSTIMADADTAPVTTTKSISMWGQPAFRGGGSQMAPSSDNLPVIKCDGLVFWDADDPDLTRRKARRRPVPWAGKSTKQSDLLNIDQRYRFNLTLNGCNLTFTRKVTSLLGSDRTVK